MKINLAVMFGGRTVEHEVSIISAQQAIASANKEKYNIIRYEVINKRVSLKHDHKSPKIFTFLKSLKKLQRIIVTPLDYCLFIDILA